MVPLKPNLEKAETVTPESADWLTDYYNHFTKVAQFGRETQKSLIIEFFDTLSLALKKNEAYGDTVFEDSCFGQPAGEAIFVRMSDKIARLRRLLENEHNLCAPAEVGPAHMTNGIPSGETKAEARSRQLDLLGESIEDTLRDLAAYSLLAIIQRKGWR